MLVSEVLGQDVSRDSVKYNCDQVIKGENYSVTASLVCISGREVVVQKELHNHHKVNNPHYE